MNTHVHRKRDHERPINGYEELRERERKRERERERERDMLFLDHLKS